MSARWIVFALLPVVLAAGCTRATNIARYNDIAFGDTRRAPNRILGGYVSDLEPVAAEAAVGYEGRPTATALVTKVRFSDRGKSTAGGEYGPVIGQDAESPERLLIRDAGLVIGVANHEEAVRRAQAVAGELGGYAQEAATSQVVLRVPADRFDEALVRLSALGIVSDRKVQARDVTDAYADLQLRLKTKRATLERLQALLGRAEKVEDLLKIEKELERLTVDVERLEGALRLMAHRVSMSKIAVEFIESTQAASREWTPELPFPWLQALGLGGLMN
jgi:Domain of unknown function (DUF4349)